MVVFNCNACSAVLKRNQVDKHCLRCRQCESLSCVDCGKDFWGDDYQKHTKCMTEEEKYCGKDNVPKVFKGEAKQEQWVEQVQAAIEKASSKPKLKWVLERLRDYPNIPRKKAKFENFVKNSLKVQSTTLVGEVWDVLMTSRNVAQAQNGTTGDVKNTDPQNKSDTSSVSNGHVGEESSNNDQKENDTVEEPSVPKSKRERKEERRQKAHKKEKKDKVLETTEVNTVGADVSKKTKKRKRHESDEVEEQVVDNEDSKGEKDLKKKKKKKNKGADVSDELIVEEANSNNDSRVESIEEEAPPAKRKKTKFNWETVIKAVLEKKGEMTLKKLKKKVLSEFAAQDAANYNEDNLSAKFDKKVLRTEGVKVFKDRATLKTK